MHARRNFEELTRDGTSPVNLDAAGRFARIFEVEGELKALYDGEGCAHRRHLAQPLWEELKRWLELERRLVADGAARAKVIDDTLRH